MNLNITAGEEKAGVIYAETAGIATITIIVILASPASNVTKGKPCHSESSSMTPDKVLDGNDSTRYAAGSICNNNTYFFVDLGITKRNVLKPFLMLNSYFSFLIKPIYFFICLMYNVKCIGICII